MFKPYSQREKERLGGAPDVYRYNEVPVALRNQITKIWERFFGKDSFSYSGGMMLNSGWKRLRSDIAEHQGSRFIKSNMMSNREAVCEWFSENLDTRLTIDVLDISVNVILDFDGSDERRHNWKSEISALEAVEQINTRLREHAIGYEFVGGERPQLVKKDNEFVHSETVMPALMLLNDPLFEAADAEYRSAHHHYLNDHYDECLTECAKALESTLIVICKRRNWELPKKLTASQLIQTVLKNGLLGDFMEPHLGNFQAALETGATALRNNLGAHGDGSQTRKVPRFYAEYMIQETAVNIVLLVEASRALPPPK